MVDPSNFEPQILRDLPAEFDSIKPILAENLTPYIKISETRVTEYSNQIPTDPLSRWQSKICGDPYFPKSETYPTDPVTGYPMALLAQINCADVPAIAGFSFPNKGILQFYLGGFQFADAYNEQRVKVIYFPDILENEEELITDFSFINWDETFRQDYNQVYELTFTASQDLFWSEFPIDILSDFPGGLINELNDWIYNYYYDNSLDHLGSKLGGYPDMHGSVDLIVETAQGRLLLELSEFHEGDDYLFFFIQDDQLQVHDFSEAEFFHEAD